MKRKLLFAIVALMCSVGSWAQDEYPKDMTSSITNWDFTGCSNGNFPGWTISAPNGGNTWVHGETAVEYWIGSAVNGAFDYYQVLTDMPLGKYTLSASMWNSTNGAGGEANGNAGVYGTSNGVTVFAGVTDDCDDANLHEYVTDEITVLNGELRVGVKNNGTMGARWFGVDWIKLTMVSAIEISDYVDQYNTAKTNAKAIDQEQKMSSAAKTALQNAISTYETVDETSVDVLTEATNALKAATQQANVSIASYAIVATGIIPDNSLEGWTCTNANTFHINTWSVEGNPGNDPSGMVTPFIENWVGKGSFLGAGTVSYTLEGLEPGEVYYAQALVRSYNEANADAPNGPNFFINDAVTSLADAGTTFTYNGMSGIYATLGGAATVGADGKLTLGVEIADDRNYNWVAFKNVTIRPMADALKAAVDKAEALYDQLPDAAKQDLEAVVSANDQPWTTPDKFESAIAAIEAAVAVAQPFVAPYAAWTEAKAEADAIVGDHEGMKALLDAENTNVVNATEVVAITEATTAVKAIANAYQAWKTLKANADALVAADNDNATANNVLKGAIDTYAAQVAEATSVEEVKTDMDDLKAEMVTYAYDANPAEGAQFDLTFMLTNPDVTAFWDGTVGESNSADTGTWWIQPEGWYNDQDGGNFQVMANNEMSLTEVFMEYWSENPRTSCFVLYQKATLPKGTYKMTGRVGLNQPVGGTTANMTFSANETDGTKIAVGLMADQEVEFVNTVEQEVKIGLKAHKGNCYRWIGINNIKLFKLPEAAPVTLDENVAYDYTYAGAASAQLTRTISEGFNTVMLPFSLTADEVAEYLGEGQLYSFSNADLGILNFASSTDLQANTPYLFKANTANNIENVEIPGRTFVVAPADQVVAAGSDYNFVGTYAPLTAGNDVITAADFVLGADKFVIAKGGNALKAFRAFIQANEEVAPVKALTINLDGVATAIEAIDGKAIANGAIYNLAGQRVSKAQKGIFIQNGKKVIK